MGGTVRVCITMPIIAPLWTDSGSICAVLLQAALQATVRHEGQLLRGLRPREAHGKVEQCRTSPLTVQTRIAIGHTKHSGRNHASSDLGDQHRAAPPVLVMTILHRHRLRAPSPRRRRGRRRSRRRRRPPRRARACGARRRRRSARRRWRRRTRSTSPRSSP